MLRPLLFSTVAAAALAASTAAFAETVQVGILECAGGPSVGYLIGSSAGLNCAANPRRASKARRKRVIRPIS